MGLGKLVSIVACAGPLATAMLVHDGGAHDIGLMDVARLANRTGKTEPKKVKVLVYGDRWAFNGCGSNLLETMFAFHSVPADVRHVRGHLTGACASHRKDKSILTKAVDEMFKDGPPDYLWYTAGGMDLLHPEEGFLKACKKEAVEGEEAVGKNSTEKTDKNEKKEAVEGEGAEGKNSTEKTDKNEEAKEAEAKECLGEATKATMNTCTDEMLAEMWAKYKNIKVVQAGYDYSCDEGLCGLPGLGWSLGNKNKGYCGDDRVCHRRMFKHWQDFLLKEEYHKFGDHAASYTGINILGAMQMAYKKVDEKAYPKATGLGEPDVSRGSPCAYTFLCTGPKKGTPGYAAIADAFWSQYFESEMEKMSPSEKEEEKNEEKEEEKKEEKNEEKEEEKKEEKKEEETTEKEKGD